MINDKNEIHTDVTNRKEKDLLGNRMISSNALIGIHTARAFENFPITGSHIHPSLIHAFGQIKLAAAKTNRSIGAWSDDTVKADAIEAACKEMSAGFLDAHIIIDSLQGGAGTSTNMNVNEVLANRALQLCGDKAGNYARISPLDDINLNQSTNDAYPTSLKLAAIIQLGKLEENITALVEAFQNKEKEFADILKIGRTQLQDAVPITLGREMSAYAAAFGRDRWRISKCEERLRVVNLGGTAIGTGITAPRDFIFRATETLRDITGIGFARAEDMVENTQNADVFVEVSGFLKACAATFIKCATDLRLLSSGPEAGFGEISLPALQAGSSIMPGKVNPVIPEAVTQAAIRMIGYDLQITMAASAGNLELNPFLPLIADCLLHGIDILSNAAFLLREKCVEGILANKEKCMAHVEGSTAIVTALVPDIGYANASEIAKKANIHGKTIRQIVVDDNIMSENMFNERISSEALLRLGFPSRKKP